jgi:hypothetical protein
VIKNLSNNLFFFAGNFIRHGCSAFGEVEHMNNKTPNYIQHLFDCLESGTRFKFENGHVTFSNRYYKYTEIKGNFEVLYIPWILRINLFQPTNPKDELV